MKWQSNTDLGGSWATNKDDNVICGDFYVGSVGISHRVTGRVSSLQDVAVLLVCVICVTSDKLKPDSSESYA